MSSKNDSAIQQSLPSEDDFYDLFAELDELEPFDIKKEELAAQLAALLSYSNKTRSEFAASSGWKKSRVTNVLNGRGNPTFKTMWEFARYLGFEADLNFRHPNEAPAKQPWHCIKEGGLEYYSPQKAQPCYVFDLQTVGEVARDMIEGNHKDIYLSFSKAATYIPKQSTQFEHIMPIDLLQMPITLVTKTMKGEIKEQI